MSAQQAFTHFTSHGRQEDLRVCSRLLKLSPGAESTKRLMAGFEAAFAGRRSTIRNAFEDIDVLGDDTPDFPRRRFRDHAAGLRRRSEPRPLTRLRCRNQEGRVFHKASSA